jgi:WD40 repeat protein
MTTGSFDDNKNGLTNYELLRLENIRRNHEFCANLGLQNIKNSIDETLSNKKKEKGMHKRNISPSSLKQHKEPTRRSERINIGTKNALEEEENSLCVVENPRRKKSRKFTTIDDYSQTMENLSRSFNNLLTPNRITTLIFHPTITQDPILVAGDKDGFLSIWNTKNNFLSENNENNKIFQKQPHKSKINNLFIGNDENKLFSVSNDGDVKRLDLATQKFMTEYSCDWDVIYNQKMFVSSSFSSQSCLYVGKSDGNLSFIDFRASNFKFQWDYKIQHEKINSVQEHPTTDHLVITAGAGKKGMICIHDIRSLGENNQKALVSIDQHLESIFSANVSPDGQFLLSVSQDNTLRTWKSFCDPNMFSRTLSSNNNNVK